MDAVELTNDQVDTYTESVFIQMSGRPRRVKASEFYRINQPLSKITEEAIIQSQDKLFAAVCRNANVKQILHKYKQLCPSREKFSKIKNR